MIRKALFTISVLALYNVLFFFSDNPWFVYFPKNTLLILSGLCLGIYISQLLFQNTYSHFLNLISKYQSIVLSFIFLPSFLFMVFFPIQNLNLGDGVILLEHVALEAKIFGFHLTMDEILEAMIHSILYAKYSNLFESPMEVYRLISTLFGLCALGILFYYFIKFKMNLSSYLLILSSGGIYLFHGYSENYTIITTFLWVYILFVVNTIKANEIRNLKALIPICFIACLLILLHLVSGYLVFSLIFLCYHFSDRGKFFKNALISTFSSLLILLPIFLYFTLFSEVRFDFTQTHLTNPKFYPLSKIISKTHFRDILFCVIGSAFLGSMVLFYVFIFYKEKLFSLLKKPEYQFLGFVLFGFMIHGFVHYPQLGFPADWDLLAFFWSPIVFIAAFLLTDLINVEDNPNKPINYLSYELIALFVFSILIFGINAIYLNRPDLEKMHELKSSIERVNVFSKTEESNYLKQVKPEYKKFYLKVSFFLFESFEKIKSTSTDSDLTAARLLQENKSFQEELMNHISNVEGKWQKDFYARLTRYHLEYLDFLKKK
jgi:hypothetical protein